MKIFFLFIASLFYTLNSAAQNPFAGDWEGKIGAIRLVFHLTEKDGKLSATMDSPDQGAKGLNCDEVMTTGDSITIKLNIATASYNGMLSADKNKITGTWVQRGQSVPLNIQRGTTVVNEMVKPQTPKPPYPYQSEEVEYDNANHTVHFGATLTKPNGAGPFPAVIIISGSGSQDRDGSMFGHKTYLVLADYLTRNGIAVLRVDDRGIGKSTIGKDPKLLTSADFATDVETSLSYLLSRPDLDKKHIGLIGHSEGGMIAPMVAARNKNVSFIVLLAGPGQKGIDIWNYQMQRAFERKDLTGNDKKIADTLINKINNAYLHSADINTIQTEIKTTYADWKKNVSDKKEKELLAAPGPEAFLKFSNTLSNGLAWLQYFMLYDPSINLSKLKIPVLAVNGEADIQIVAAENLPLIEAALKKGGNKKYTIKSFPHLNHLFQTSTVKDQSYDKIEETFSPIALDYITQWIKTQVK